MTIRPVEKSDIPALKAVLDSIDLFPSELLEDMISDYFEHSDTDALWFAAIEQNNAVALGYCSQEQLTEGTYNLHAIGVLQSLQGKGIGTEMMHYLEKQLKAAGHRILIVETSGTADFTLTRKFYENLQYTREATIRDFWGEGDDKVVYWKKFQ